MGETKGEEFSKKPQIDFIEFQCSGWIGKNTEEHTRLLDKEVKQLLKKHGHIVETEWTN